MNPLQKLRNLHTSAKTQAAQEKERLRLEQAAFEKTEPAIPPDATPVEIVAAHAAYRTKADRLRRAEQSFSIASRLSDLLDDTAHASLFADALKDLRKLHASKMRRAKTVVEADSSSLNKERRLPIGGLYGRTIVPSVDQRFSDFEKALAQFPENTTFIDVLALANAIETDLTWEAPITVPPSRRTYSYP